MFSIYKKLQYMKKLLLVQKFDKMLCAVKKMCKDRKDILFADTTGGGFSSEISIKVNIDKVKLRYIQCYGVPKGCYDEELLEKIREELKNEN